MSEFLEAVREYQFMQYALLTAVLASVACGVVGTYVVVRRITYIAGGISHSVLGGIGAAAYLNRACGLEWIHPMHGAVFAALLSALIIGYVGLRCREREDTIIGAVWAIGMATGIMFLFKTPGYSEGLESHLFGSILMVSRQELLLVAVLDVVVVAAGLLFYNQFQAVCFDDEFARTRGVNVEFYYLLLLLLTALTVVLLVAVVGIIMVIALVTLPVAVAGKFSRTLWQMMVLATLFSVIFTTTGIALSYEAELPPGVTIILTAGVAYLIVMVGGYLVKAISRRTRQS